MRLLILLATILLLLSSCDPFQMVYVKNYSSNEIKVDVHLSNRYPHPKPFEVNSIDSLVEDKKAIFDIRFDKKLSINNISDSLYQVILPAESTSLLEPTCIGFPIRKIFIVSGNQIDSIIFYDSNHNLKQLKKEKLIKKASMATFIVDFRKE